jgi:uncharacterized membrane protein YgdD (TMEM256/DUF423 family)
MIRFAADSLDEQSIRRTCFATRLCKATAMNHRTVLRSAGISGAIGVGLGAFGAHGLRDVLLASGMANAWETGVRYHLLHAVGLFCTALWLRQTESRRSKLLGWVAGSWIAGTVLFSGSLYALALGGPRWFGPITPLGGVAFIAGWILLVVLASEEKE